MTVTRIKVFVSLASAVTVLVCAGLAQAASVPVRLALVSQLGREVNRTEAGKGPAFEDICTVESKDECVTGTPSSIPGGFEYPEGAAGASNGNVYVVDKGNHRVQEFTSAGQFVLMFGKEVNETTQGNVCTAEEIAKSQVVCKAGTPGGAPGQFSQPYSIAVDPANGDIYVAEHVEGGFGQRVQKFTPEGSLVLEIGKEVNETTRGNLCTHEEELTKGVKCTAPAQGEPASSEGGSFDFEEDFGDLLSVDSESNLYVGDEGRVQEFTQTGVFTGNIPLEAGRLVYALAVDQSKDLYVAYAPRGSGGGGNIVRVVNLEGKELRSFAISPEEPGALVTIQGFALDQHEHLAVVSAQRLPAGSVAMAGALFKTNGTARISTFKIPTNYVNVKGLGFDDAGEMYVATGFNHAILAYKPLVIAELLTGSSLCVPGSEQETNEPLNCTLEGEVNPEGVSETEAWFNWGRTEVLGEQTAKQPVLATGSFSAIVSLRPNATFYYQLAGEDQNSKAPEVLTAEQKSLTTPLVAPKMVGTPSVQFMTSTSAVLFGELNPENASSEYFFEYAPGTNAFAKCPGGVRRESCSGVAVTSVARSAVYGKIGATIEATGLQPGTLYSYRLFAENEDSSKPGERLASVGSEGTFTTAPTPAPSVTTGGVSAVGTTSATISGTIEPDGVATTYSFELGVDEGANTQYAVVFSGSAGASTTPVVESLPLTGLQPGTSYAFRLTISSGYINNEAHTIHGQPVAFTTNGLPAVINEPPAPVQLPLPSMAFPKTSSTPAKKLASKKRSKKKMKGRRRKHKIRPRGPRRT